MKTLQPIETPDMDFHVVKDGKEEWHVWATLKDGSFPADGFIVGIGDSPKNALAAAVTALCTAITELTTSIAAQ